MNNLRREYLADVNKDYPLLAVLKAEFPELVKSAQRHLAVERLRSDRKELKRESNPNYRESKTYQKTVRNANKAKRKAVEKLASLADAAGISREVFGLPKATPSTRNVPVSSSLKEGFLHEICEGFGELDQPQPSRVPESLVLESTDSDNVTITSQDCHDNHVE